MVNPAKLTGLVRDLREYITYLRDLAELNQGAVLSDPYKRGAARYYLQVAIESCLDIAAHVIASEQLRPPATYRETFQILSEAGLIPDDFLPTLQQMASMRNRLVHLYADVDDQLVYSAIATAPADCERFVQLIFDYIQPTEDTSEV